VQKLIGSRVAFYVTPENSETHRRFAEISDRVGPAAKPTATLET
jgi:hypothetical protein